MGFSPPKFTHLNHAAPLQEWMGRILGQIDCTVWAKSIASLCIFCYMLLRVSISNAVTFQQRIQTILPSCYKGKYKGTIVRWITQELIPQTLLSVDSLVTMKHKKCVFQFSENWAFLCPIKPVLREGKLLRSHLIRTNDRCCKQGKCFNSDLNHWFASVANYYLDWGYAFNHSSGGTIFLFATTLSTKQF